jgi:hypothetical protein
MYRNMHPESYHTMSFFISDIYVRTRFVVVQIYILSAQYRFFLFRVPEGGFPWSIFMPEFLGNK